MMDFRRVETTREVWAVIHASHPELKVVSSYSAPDGGEYHPTQGRMYTDHGFEDSPIPLISARTFWDIDRNDPLNRIDQRDHFWLCVPIEEGEEW